MSIDRARFRLLMIRAAGSGRLDSTRAIEQISGTALPSAAKEVHDADQSHG